MPAMPSCGSCRNDAACRGPGSRYFTHELARSSDSPGPVQLAQGLAVSCIGAGEQSVAATSGSDQSRCRDAAAEAQHGTEPGAQWWPGLDASRGARREGGLSLGRAAAIMKLIRSTDQCCSILS